MENLNQDLTDKEIVLRIFARSLDDIWDGKIAKSLAYYMRDHPDHPRIVDLVNKHLIELDNELLDIILI